MQEKEEKSMIISEAAERANARPPLAGKDLRFRDSGNEHEGADVFLGALVGDANAKTRNLRVPNDDALARFRRFDRL